MQKYRPQLTSIMKYPPLDSMYLWGLVNVHVCPLRNSIAHHHFAKMAVWR